MQGHLDETEFVRSRHSEEEIIILESEQAKGPLLAQVKSKVFSIFFRMNTLKMPTAIHYHLVMLLIESFQLLSLVLVEGGYSSSGPYESGSPWNLSQTQWLIDVCWVFRVDRYFRTNFVGYLVLMGVWATLVCATVSLGVVLAFMQKMSSLNNFLLKALKILSSLLCDLLFIPVIDSLAFGMKCSLSASSQCMDIRQGYEFLVLFIACAFVFLALVCLCSLLYYDFCFVCGGIMAKPHPRIKILRLLGYVVVVFAFYFTTSGARVILFLLIALGVGIVLSYVHMQYVPYFNPKIAKMRLGMMVSFTSAVFCMMIGEFFKTTDKTNSSVTMLFYFLTPCLVQITQLGLIRRGRVLKDRKMQHLSNIYQVEIKGRMHVAELEEARSKSAKSLYSEEEGNQDENFKNVHDRSLREIESLYAEAFKKFPNSEFLYLWSGLLQLHMFESYVLAMVQCFKGMMIANKLDSQYAFYHFCRTSASCYKQYMKDDAYEYVLFEKCLANAQKNDESVTRSQFYFWTELESKTPKIQKLTVLAGQTSSMIGVAKSNYQLLIKLNAKSTQALRMYGGFLKSLNNFSDVGDRYIQKAEMQDEAQGKSASTSVLNTLTQPLSFFDIENAIISVSGDFETLGEIQKVNTPTMNILGYYQAEMIGRNISLVIPSPFAEVHDECMKRFHEVGSYTIIDNSNLMLYFVNKAGHMLEGRALVKVVPNEEKPPFLMAVIMPTRQEYCLMMLNKDFYISSASEQCDKLFDLASSKNTELKVETVISNFAEIKEKMSTSDYVPAKAGKDSHATDIKCCLSKFTLGSTHFSYLLKILIDKKEPEEHDAIEKPLEFEVQEQPQESGRQISTLKPAAKDLRINFVQDPPQDPPQSSSESEEESGSEDESSSSEESSSSQSSKESSKKQSSASSAVQKEQHQHLISKSESESDSKERDESSHSISASRSEHEEVDEEEGNDGKSALSSSKSMGSSMASLAYFNKHIKALISYEFSRTKQYVWRFKLTLIATIVLLIVTSVLTFQVIKSSAKHNEELSHFVNLVGNLRLYSVSLAYYIRVITLMDAGFLPNDKREQYFQWLSEDAADMHETNLRLYRNYDMISSSDRAMYIDETIPTWLMEGERMRLIKTNLFDATSNVVLQSYLIRQELSQPPLTLKNRRAFYVYRNGEGELLEALDRSSLFYVNSALRDIDQERLTAILLIMASVLVLLFCAGFAIIPAIRTLEKSKREVWDIFFEIPGYVCRIMKGRCNDRLSLLNESASVEMEDLKQEEAPDDEKEGDEGTKREVTKTTVKTTENQGKRKKRGLNDNRKVLTFDPRQRKIVLLKLCCFFLISLVYFYLIYYTGFETIGKVLEEEPVTINWASRRRQLSRSINLWALETLVENVTDIGYKFVVPTGQNLGSPPRAAEWVTNELEHVENSLIFGNPEEGLSFNEMRGSTHDALLFADACTAPTNRSLADCDVVGNKALKQGLHSALGMYITLSRTVLQTITNGVKAGWTWTTARTMYLGDDMKLLRDLDEHYLYDPLTYSSKLYESDYTATQEQMAMWQNLLISLYSIFAIFFFFLVYNPMIHKVTATQIGQDTKNAWSMCTLIPQEYQEEFKLLNAAVKDRRDSFKWR